MKEVTIICCYNNLKQYKTFTESLAKQTTEYELIGIDNTKSKYTSCSKAFNHTYDGYKDTICYFLSSRY